MKKRILALLSCMFLAVAVTACSSAPAESSVEPTITPAASASPDPAATPEASVESGMDTSDMATGSLDSYAKSVKEAYGGDYIPDRMLADNEVEEKLGLTKDMYEDIYAEGATLDENPDIFVAVKAKSGKTTEVEQKLKEYKDKLAGDTAYSANVDRIQAAEVYSNGDHVFLFLLGKNQFTEGVEDMAEGFAGEMKKGVDAVKQMFS